MNQVQASRLPIPDRRSWLWLAIAAVLFVFANGMYRNALAGLLAPLFLIRFLRTRKVGRGYLLMVLVLMAANIIAWWDLMPNFTTPVRIIFGLSMSFLVFPWGLDSMLLRVFPALVFPIAAYRSNKPLHYFTGIRAFFAGLGIMCAGAPGASHIIGLALQAIR